MQRDCNLYNQAFNCDSFSTRCTSESIYDPYPIPSDGIAEYLINAILQYSAPNPGAYGLGQINCPDYTGQAKTLFAQQAVASAGPVAGVSSGSSEAAVGSGGIKGSFSPYQANFIHSIHSQSGPYIGAGKVGSGSFNNYENPITGNRKRSKYEPFFY
jgi:hypothetical protein